MAISEEKEVLYSTVDKELKNWLQEQADKNHRSLSKEVAHVLSLYKSGLLIKKEGENVD